MESYNDNMNFKTKRKNKTKKSSKKKPAEKESSEENSDFDEDENFPLTKIIANYENKPKSIIKLKKKRSKLKRTSSKKSYKPADSSGNSDFEDDCDDRDPLFEISGETKRVSKLIILKQTNPGSKSTVQQTSWRKKKVKKKKRRKNNNDSDDDNYPLVHINLDSDGADEDSPSSKHHKIDEGDTIKQETKEEPSVQVNPFYCKICFIKAKDEQEALEHEKGHNRFRNVEGKWTCVICGDLFLFYCDLLNHFFIHDDMLELYSVYLSNLDTRLDGRRGYAESDEESDYFENEFKHEMEGLDTSECKEEKPEESGAIQEDANKATLAGHPKPDSYSNTWGNSSPSRVDTSLDTQHIQPDANNVVLKSELEDEALTQRFEDYYQGDSDSEASPSRDAEDDVVKSEEQSQDVSQDFCSRFDDSDEDEPLSIRAAKAQKKKTRENTDDSNEKRLRRKHKKKSKKREKPAKKRRIRSSEEKAMPYAKFYRLQKCDKCEFKASRRDEMENHSAVHVEGEPVSCNLCEFRCKIERQLTRHKHIVHEGHKFICDMCEFTSKTLANLRRHLLGHGERKIECNICGKKFKRKNNLNDHLRTHTDDRPFKCSECPKTFKDAKGCKVHMFGVHNIAQQLACEHCDFQTDSRQEMNSHKTSVHRSLYMQILPVPNEKGEVVNTVMYACNVCDYVANTEANLKRHLIVHNEKNISCEICGKLFRRLCNLLEHKRSHSENRPFVCPVCPEKAFKDSKSYRRHIARQHDLLKMIKCDICDYKTHTKGLLKIHIMKHNGQLRFKCNECSFSCMTRNTIRKHKLMHNDMLPMYAYDYPTASEAIKRHKPILAQK